MSDGLESPGPEIQEAAASELSAEEVAIQHPPNEEDPLTAEWDAFDDEFVDHRTPFETIIRGHLYVQAALIELVEAVFDEPDAIDLAKMDFSILVQLAVALGLLARDDAPGFHKLNQLRNRFAHNLNAEYTLQNAIDFYNTLGPRHRVGASVNTTRPFVEEQKFYLTFRCIKALVFGTKFDLRNFIRRLDDLDLEVAGVE